MNDREEIEELRKELDEVAEELYPRTDYIEVKDTDGNVVERIETHFNGPGVPDIRHVGYVPKDDLRELVNDLRDKEGELRGANERIEGYEYARKELEMLLDA